ncbi:uncharacterized protein LOC128555057 [Mercenaria mercenaria]|uniref:uncharacterized protein LOC128555057 n=1 Tax=Mercenaria mercenaria TaxID=6596 RepID=UPI00234FAAE8|nr:uncharacterized protein LOC128555057 [Mercenaria mercenaria]
MDITNRRKKARDVGLCFMCLRDNHRGNNCKNFRVCGTNGCTKNHHKLLHCQQSPLNSNAQKSITKNGDTFGEPKQQQQQGFFTRKSQIALRTVPVVVYTENSRKILINALLEGGSTKTYINQSLAGELGLQGKIETVQVNTLNDKVQTFETMSVSLTVKSLYGQSQTEMDALVLDNVIGSLQTVNWNKYINKWEHLKGINFPFIDQNRAVDMLIGLDYATLHSSLHEIRGKAGEPVARLTPLGCVGQLDNDPQQISLFSTYFVNEPDDLDQMLKGFWEIDNSGLTIKEQPLTQIEQKVLKESEKDMKVEDGRYEVKIPWKTDPSNIPNDYEMAVKRLQHTEKRLKKEPNIEIAYTETIENYVNKGYIHKVPQDETDPVNKWYFPHFPVVRLEKETTKVRIVFDASAKYNGVCLNDFIQTGPKLQNELFDVLLRFRKYDIALVCDISEMYLRVGIHETNIIFHRFLWDSCEYEFSTLVFGVKASPFLAHNWLHRQTRN